jgi:hypothetical protein
MTSRNAVRSHTRRTAGGKTTRVRQHTRRGIVTPRHSWKLLSRAVRAGRRGRKLAALGLGLAGAAEMAAWLTLSGTALLLATAAVLAAAAACAAAMAGGIPVPGGETAGRRTAPRRGHSGGGK